MRQKTRWSNAILRKVKSKCHVKDLIDIGGWKMSSPMTFPLYKMSLSGKYMAVCLLYRGDVVPKV